MPVASTATSYYDLLAAYLAAAQAALTADIVGCPDRVCVTVGTPVHDCNQLVAYSPQLGPLQRGNAPGILDPGRALAVGSVNQVQLIVEEAVCLPAGANRATATPTAAQLDARAQSIYRSGWVVYNAIGHAVTAGTLFPDFIDGRNVLRGPLLFPEPSGAFAAWSLEVDVELYGMP